MHDAVSVGDLLYVTWPRNTFPLCVDAERHLLIAGGIGITPILAMPYALHRDGATFEVHYCARDAECASFADELRSLCAPGHLHFHFDDGDPARGLDLRELLEAYKANTHLYVCGPKGLLDGAVVAAGHWPGEAIHFERFTAVAANQRAHGDPFEIQVMPEGRIVAVGRDETALVALLRSGAQIPYQCEGGICGTCRVCLVSGEVIHRDAVLKPEERADTMITCVSRGRGRIGIALIGDDD